MKIFVSYPNKSKTIGQTVAKLCRGDGHEVFLALEKGHILASGPSWLHVLNERLEQSDAFVLCLTKESLTARTQKEEWGKAHALVGMRAIVVYTGRWRSSYTAEYPFIEGKQRFCLDDGRDVQGIRAWLRELPPDEERFRFVQKLAIGAGMKLLGASGARFLVGKPKLLNQKKNPATDLDLQVQDYIVHEIEGSFESEPILAEERQYNTVPKGRRDAEYIWTVDPLDGTLNFIAGDGCYCCGIGLLKNGVPYMGAIFIPSRMELISGGTNRPAMVRYLCDGTTEPLKSDQEIEQVGDCYALTHVNSERKNVDLCFQDEFPLRLHKAVRRVWMLGCGLIALTNVARGRHHLFVQRRTYPWDVVPGLAILEAAGGEFSKWPIKSARQWRYSGASRLGIVAAANSALLDEFIGVMSAPS